MLWEPVWAPQSPSERTGRCPSASKPRPKGSHWQHNWPAAASVLRGKPQELWGKQQKTTSLTVTGPHQVFREAGLRECDFMPQGNGRGLELAQLRFPACEWLVKDNINWEGMKMRTTRGSNNRRVELWTSCVWGAGESSRERRLSVGSWEHGAKAQEVGGVGNKEVG